MVQDAVVRGDWMISLDMKDAYIHIPIQYQSRRFLRFVFDKEVYEFKVIFYALSTVPQVFTRVLAGSGPIEQNCSSSGFQNYPVPER